MIYLLDRRMVPAQAERAKSRAAQGRAGARCLAV
jgi:hypothetical protein